MGSRKTSKSTTEFPFLLSNLQVKKIPIREEGPALEETRRPLQGPSGTAGGIVEEKLLAVASIPAESQCPPSVTGAGPRQNKPRVGSPVIGEAWTSQSLGRGWWGELK